MAERAAALIGEDGAALAPLLGPIAGATATVVADAEAARAGAVRRAGGGVGPRRPGRPWRCSSRTSTSPARARWRGWRSPVAAASARSSSSRPGPAAGRASTRRTVITLGPLDRGAVAELVGADRADALYERSGGHPLLLAALAASGEEELPATLRDAVAAQVDSLGEAVAATLRIAAVLGPDVRSRAGGPRSRTAPVVEVLAHLEAAARAGVLVERGSRFGFRHELVREAVEAATGAARRALVHQLAARALAARPDPDPLAVAVHARAGGDRTLAAVVVPGRGGGRRRSVRPRRRRGAPGRGPRPRGHPGGVHGPGPAPDESPSTYDAAAADAEQAIALGGGAAALEVAGWVAYYRRRYDDARAYADEAVARADDDAVRVVPRSPSPGGCATAPATSPAPWSV